MKRIIWTAESINVPLSSDEYAMWRRWLFWGVADSTVMGWSYDTLPDAARTLALTCVLEKRFHAFQVRQHDRNKGECALLGTAGATGRGHAEWGTWTLLARWNSDDKPPCTVPEIKNELRVQLSRELSRRGVAFGLSAFLATATICFFVGHLFRLGWLKEDVSIAFAIFIGILAAIEFGMTTDARNKTRILLEYISR